MPMHSAISSSLPPSPTHSSLHVYILLLPQPIARLPLRTGFHDACITALSCASTVFSRGTKFSRAAGNSYRYIAFGELSSNRSTHPTTWMLGFVLTKACQKIAPRYIPIKLHNTTPRMGFCHVCLIEWYNLCTSQSFICEANWGISKNRWSCATYMIRNPGPLSLPSIWMAPAIRSEDNVSVNNWRADRTISTTAAGIRLVSSKVTMAVQLKLSRM
jgi:hypothetical protein